MPVPLQRADKRRVDRNLGASPHVQAMGDDFDRPSIGRGRSIPRTHMNAQPAKGETTCAALRASKLAALLAGHLLRVLYFPAIDVSLVPAAPIGNAHKSGLSHSAQFVVKRSGSRLGSEASARSRTSAGETTCLPVADGPAKKTNNGGLKSKTKTHPNIIHCCAAWQACALILAGQSTAHGFLWLQHCS